MTKEEFSAKLDYIQEHVRLEAKFKFEEVKEKLLNIPRYKHIDPNSESFKFINEMMEFSLTMGSEVGILILLLKLSDETVEKIVKEF